MPKSKLVPRVSRTVNASPAHVHRNRGIANQDRGFRRVENPHGDPRDGDSSHAAGKRERQAFGEHLANHASAGRPQRQPHRKLASAAARAGEHQVRQIDARDQQD